MYYTGLVRIRIAPSLWTAAGILAAVATNSGAQAAEPTAFDLVKQANRYVGEQSKDRLVQIRSEKSDGTLTPNIWYVVLYDPTASLKAAEVKFGSGKMLTVTRPMRLLEPVTGGDLPLDHDKLKIDSPKAIKIARKEPQLRPLKLTAIQLKLERIGEGVLGQGGAAQAVWKVRFWAAKRRDPGRDADIGEVWISAMDGQLVRNDFHIDRVD